MILPRSWTSIERQRDPEQARLNAQPVATDSRFKAAAFLLLCAWLTTVFSLHHSIKHYKPRNRGPINRTTSIIRYTPTKFLLTLSLSLIMIGYEIAIAFNFSVSPLNIDSHLLVIFLAGWLPIALIILVYEIAGFIDPNEDRELIRQRRIRGAEADDETGITHKPHWWSRLHGVNQPLNVHDVIAPNVSEIADGNVTHSNLENDIEMGDMPASSFRASDLVNASDTPTRSQNPEAIRLSVNLSFPDQSGESSQRPDRFAAVPKARRNNNIYGQGTSQNNDTRSGYSGGINGTNSRTTAGANPQQIKSMLDI